jgi:hypothetical protein
MLTGGGLTRWSRQREPGAATAATVTAVPAVVLVAFGSGGWPSHCAVTTIAVSKPRAGGWNNPNPNPGFRAGY